MSLSDKQIRRVTEERIVTIDEVNMDARHISARDQYGTLLMTQFDPSQPIVVIPKPGEVWTVERQNTSWRLKQRHGTGTADITIQGDTFTVASSTVNINGSSINLTGNVLVNNSPIGGSTAGTYSHPIIIPMLIGSFSNFDGFGWTNVRTDSSSRFNAVRTNQSGFHTAALNDYLTFYAMLGPQNSIWQMNITYLARSNGGKATFSVASVEDSDGRLLDNAHAYFSPNGSISTIDMYSSTTVDSESDGVMQFRIGGAPGDIFSSTTTDAQNYKVIDGGPGTYSFMVKVTGKNASSSGYQCDISGISLVRINEVGDSGGF